MKNFNGVSVGKGKRQGGFTIIELVVVILLLGILTATALPRFMDISDEAHGAVVNSVTGSLRTGLALYHAQWLASGQPDNSVAVDYDGVDLYPNAGGDGYPASSGDLDFDAESDCTDVFNGLVTMGGMTIDTINWDAAAANIEANIEATLGANDWLGSTATDPSADPETCIYYYTGQFASGTDTAPSVIPALTYDVTAGTVTPGTFTLQED
ncbi:MAG: type II secretion system protein [Pseudohongiellaceae bacterium]